MNLNVKSSALRRLTAFSRCKLAYISIGGAVRLREFWRQARYSDVVSKQIDFRSIEKRIGLFVELEKS